MVFDSFANLFKKSNYSSFSSFTICLKGSLILIGGNVVLLYASKFNDVSIVVNMSGRFNLERGIEGRLGKDFLQRIKETGFIDVWNKRGK